MSPGAYVVGLLVFALTVAGVALATQLVVGRRLAHLRGAEQLLGWALVFTLALLATQVVPLALGILAPGTSLACALLIAAAATRLPVAEAAARVGDPEREPPPSGRLSVAVAAVAIAALTAFEIARIRVGVVAPIGHVDMLNFHLPAIARWIQSGSMWQIDQLLPLFTTGYYPGNGDALIMSVIQPWDTAAFARLVALPFLALTGLAVYALGCRLGAARAAAAALAAAAVAMPELAHEAVLGMPDAIMLFGVVTGVTFGVRYARTDRRSDLVLAGLALGLAFGARWQGVTSVAAVVAVGVVAEAWRRRSPRRAILPAATLVGLIALAGGIWMVRNVIEVENPIYPQEVAIFGATIFPGTDDALLDRFGFTIAGYLGDWEIVREYFIPGFMSQLALTGPLVLVGVVAAFGQRALDAWRRVPLRFDQGATLAVAAAAVLICVVYALTPASAGGLPGEPTEMATTVRWMIPGAALAAAVAAAAATRLGRLRPAAEVAALVAVADGIRREPDRLDGVIPASAIAIGIVVVIAALVAGVLLWRSRERMAALVPRRRIVAAATAGTAVLVAVGVAGRVLERHLADVGYAGHDPTLAWIERHAEDDARIGIAGTWSDGGISPVFPSFGPELDNRVEYVGPIREGLLREYDDRDSFLAAVAAGEYDLLQIGLGFSPGPEVREERWARSAGYRQVAASERLALYARGPSLAAGAAAG